MTYASEVLATAGVGGSGAATPLYYLRLGEGPGAATYVDSGAAGSSGNLATNGLVHEGQDSLLPGEPDGFSIEQFKGTHAASRGDNAFLDRPAANPLSCCVWFYSRALNLVASHFFLKPNQYGFYLGPSGALCSYIQGQQDLGAGTLTEDSLGGLCRTQGKPSFAAFRWDPAGALGEGLRWSVLLNGAKAHSRVLTAGQTIPAASPGSFLLGGRTSPSAQGFAGRLQHMAIWYSGVSDAQFQHLYEVGMSGFAQLLGRGKNVFRWSTQIAGAGAYGREVQNHGDTTVWVTDDASASVNEGWPIYPYRSERIPSTNPLQAVHDAWSARPVAVLP